MSFLPDDYEIPSAAGNYLKIEADKPVMLRVLSQEALRGWVYWNRDRKPVRFPADQHPGNPSDAQIDKDGKPAPVRHMWAMVVWNHDAERLQVWEITQKTIQKQIHKLYKSRMYGHPKGYDIEIHRDDSSGKTEYTVVPGGKSDISPQIEQEFAEANVNLSALLTGEDPFAAQSAQADQTRRTSQRRQVQARQPVAAGHSSAPVDDDMPPLDDYEDDVPF